MWDGAVGQDLAGWGTGPWNCPTWTADRGTRQATQMRQPSYLGTACNASGRQTLFDGTEMLSAIA